MNDHITYNPETHKQPALVADIGGTNARFALCRNGILDETSIQVLACNDYENLDNAVKQYLSDQNTTATAACMAFASPVGECVSMTNNHWTFNCTEMQHKLSLSSFKVINDFTAQALALPALQKEELIKIGVGEANEHAAKLIIGPGTGLGVAGLKEVNDHWLPLPGEGGHAAFSAVTQQDTDVLNHLQSEADFVSWEDVLCGSGLERLYRAHSALSGEHNSLKDFEITTSALQEEGIARQTLLHFCELLGRAASNSALVMGAQGGVYIAGGIIPRFPEFFAESRFRHSFDKNNKMVDYLKDIPTYLVVADNPGLVGACQALDNPLV
ncbi:glucokinase [Endozoicomonas sp. (ex Bugula neritina AB1)]|nr:glucokinase [Endozoicomonas sp. (ex Bugula neritina AB1)]